jgi:hypothetical protein
MPMAVDDERATASVVGANRSRWRPQAFAGGLA